MSTRDTFFYASSIRKRGHIFKRFKIWVMNTMISADIGHVPVFFFFLGIGIGACLAFMGSAILYRLTH